MRRVLLWLCLLCICLTGCTQKPAEVPSAEDPFAQIPTVEYAAPLIDGTAISPEALSQWNWFYWNTNHFVGGNEDQIDLAPYGLAGATLCHKDDIYTITDANGSRSYSFLSMEDADDTGHFTENSVCTTFVLSVPEDPDATVSREPLFTVTTPCTDAAQFGDVPQAIWDLAVHFGRDRIICRENSCFVYANLLTALDSVRTGLHMWQRYDYSGRLLCEFSTYSIISHILELEDGSFVLADELENMTYLVCYGSDGSILWKTEVGNDLYAVELLFLNGKYYLFCQYDPEDSRSDIRIYSFGADGRIAQQAQYGGSDFDFIDYVIVSKDGFTLFGRTQGSDGDFPFSKDGYGVDFTAGIRADLTLKNPQKTSIPNTWPHELLGVLQGANVYSGDSILEATDKDQLPYQLSAEGIFDFEGGYVVVRQHRLAPWEFNPPLTSYQPSYWETVITGYSADGTPLWQLTSDVYVS